MKTCLSGMLLVLAAMGSVATAAPARYELDPEHLHVAFLTQHLGFAKTLGQFRRVSGSYVFDEAAGTVSEVRVVIETASVDTGHERRDQHLRSDDFLAASRYPQMVYTARSAKRTSDRAFILEGELELRGVKRPLALEATLVKSGPYPMGDRVSVMGVSARGQMMRSDHGMTYGVENGWVGDAVDILIEFEARQVR